MSFYGFERKLKKFGITKWDEEQHRRDFFSVVIPRDDSDSAKKICEEKFGDDWIWATPMQMDRTIIYFKNEPDVVIFKLSFATT